VDAVFKAILSVHQKDAVSFPVQCLYKERVRLGSEKMKKDVRILCSFIWKAQASVIFSL